MKVVVEPSAVIREWIERLDLIVHPEGGWYRETYRSDVTLAQESMPVGYPSERNLMTSILYLLPTGMRSHWHRVRSEELWMHHRGDDLQLRISPFTGSKPGATGGVDTVEIRLGQGPSSQFQAVVPPNYWQEALALPGAAGYSLVGCVVAPGFEFEDFEMAEQGSGDDGQ